MLIGIDASRTTAAQRTGTEAYSLALTRALLDLPGAHRWRLYFNSAPPAGIWPARAAIELRSMPWPRLWTHLRLSAEMLVAPPDVLFVPAHVLPIAAPRRCVVTVHDLGYRHFPAAHTPAARWYLDLSTRYNARRASLILTDSAATRADLLRFYGTPADKIRVVYPGRPEGVARVDDAGRIREVLGRLGLERDYILYVGTLQPRKNLVRLIEAYALLVAGWDAGDPPLLALAGRRGWLSEPIGRAIEAADLGAHVRLTGYVADADLSALYSGARLFAFPSLHEGFGFPILEAMACDAPVVCSRTSSLPEVAGEAALLVNPLDVSELAAALRLGLTDEALRGWLIEAGRRQMMRFSWRTAARETLAALEEAGA